MNHPYPDAYFGEMSRSQTSDRHTTLNTLSPYKRHLASFIDSLPEGARVLDIGCGSGRTVRTVLSLRPDIHIEACDVNDTHALLPPAVPFTLCSVEDLAATYPHNHFDAVICQHVIEHLPNPLGLMGGVQAVLKARGRIFLETPNWTRMFIPFSHMFFWNDYTHVRLYPKYALVKLLLEHGFSIETIRTCSSSTWFSRKRPGGATAQPRASGAAEGKPLVDAYRYNVVASRIAARILNPLLRDIIIIEARKEEGTIVF